jgi:ABC-type hemin transport system substrate-binding protein
LWEVTRELIAGDAELDQLRSRLNWLVTIVIGAAVTNIVIALEMSRRVVGVAATRLSQETCPAAYVAVQNTCP